MPLSPYRRRLTTQATAASLRFGDDVELLPVLAALWLASVVRVVLALRSPLALGAEPTLALLVLVSVPALLFGRREVKNP